MSKNLYAIRKGSIFVILFYFLLPLQSASAAMLEYSISGTVEFGDINGSYTKDITGTAFIDDTKTPFYDPEDLPSNCQLAPASNNCYVDFAITSFEMIIGDEYSFTGANGSLEFNSSDFVGALYGTGDFSSLTWANEEFLGPINYEEWLAFELPTFLSFYETAEVLEVTNPDFTGHRVINVSFQVVPIPAAVWLFGSGLLGLIGVARRKA